VVFVREFKTKNLSQTKKTKKSVKRTFKKNLFFLNSNNAENSGFIQNNQNSGFRICF
jgi:hypothetical protein